MKMLSLHSSRQRRERSKTMTVLDENLRASDYYDADNYIVDEGDIDELQTHVDASAYGNCTPGKNNGIPRAAVKKALQLLAEGLIERGSKPPDQFTPRSSFILLLVWIFRAPGPLGPQHSGLFA